MKHLLSLALLLPTPTSAQEVFSININRVCAAIVQIPYASDNFSDEKFEQFKSCLVFMKQYKES